MIKSRLELTATQRTTKGVKDVPADSNPTGMNLSRNSDVSLDLMSTFLLLVFTAQRLLLVLLTVVRRVML